MARQRGQTAQPKTRDAEQSTHHIIQCPATPQREADNVCMLYKHMYIYKLPNPFQAPAKKDN